MSRVVKAPRIRRKELIDAAMELFSEKGFYNTAVSDIVKRVGVAQGTFYYHFPSKNSIADALVDRYVNPLIKRISSIAGDSSIDVAARLNAILDMLFESMESHRPLLKLLVLPINDFLHSRFQDRFQDRAFPIFESLLNEGIQSGQFETDHPEETVQITLAAIAHLTRSHVVKTSRDHISHLRSALRIMLFRSLGYKDFA